MRILTLCVFAASTIAVSLPLTAAATLHRAVMTKWGWAGCDEPAEATRFLSTDAEARLWFRVNSVQAGERPTVEFYYPNGTYYWGTTWDPAPSNSSYQCYGVALYVSGHDPANFTGDWRVRILWGLYEMKNLSFNVSLPSSPNQRPEITRFDKNYYLPGTFDLTVFGSGFQRGAVADIDYAPENGQRRVNGQIFMPRLATGQATVFDNDSQLGVRLNLPDPGEFRITIRNPSNQSSETKTFIIAYAGFRLPYPSGERYRHAQGNNGTFSHHGDLAYAYDFSATNCVVAMKAGLATPRVTNRGAGQANPPRDDWGNYITIDHGNGQYSHYAHLRRDTLMFTQPQWVQQGQALAAPGSSGTTATHVHVQVTRSSDINAESWPFAFDADSDGLFSNPPDGPPPVKPVSEPFPEYLSNNYSALGSCGRSGEEAPTTRATLDGGVAHNAQWWGTFDIPQGARALRVEAAWQGDDDLDLYLFSPGDTQYAWNSDNSGDFRYSGYSANPEWFSIANPQAGRWRVKIHAWRVLQGNRPFKITVIY